MDIKLGAAPDRMESFAARTSRQSPEARQSKWLQELERELLESGRERPAAAAPSHALAPPAVPPAPDMVASQASADTGPVAGAAARGAETRPVHGATAAVRPAAEAPGRQGAADVDAAPDALPGRAAGAPAAAPATSGAGGARSEAQGQGLSGLAGTGGGAPFAYGTRTDPGAATVDALASVPEPAPRPQAWAPATGANAMTTGAQPATEESIEEGLDEPGPAPAADPAGSEAWTEQRLHLYRQGEQVQAWIRDARLDAGQARSVRAALAVELAQAGQTLVSLTVNGQRIAAPYGGALPAAPATPPTTASRQGEASTGTRQGRKA